MLFVACAHAAVPPPPGPIVVELFTSQGCNSCPPADALLGELAQRPGVLALALHITYWNDLGWKDPFSQEQFDARQRDYARQPGLRGTYTPQMLVNGSVDVVGSQRASVERALQQAHPLALIAVQPQGGELALTLPALNRPCDCVLTLFGVQSAARTPVGRGENGGRTLQEYQIVRSMQPAGSWKGGAQVLHVTPRKADADSYAILAQERTTGRLIAAGRMTSTVRSAD